MINTAQNVIIPVHVRNTNVVPNTCSSIMKMILEVIAIARVTSIILKLFMVGWFKEMSK
jgi:hypothetical protein